MNVPRSRPEASDGGEKPSLRSPGYLEFVDGEGAFVVVRPYEPPDYDRLLAMYESFDPSCRAQGIPPMTSTRLENWLEHLLDEGRNLVAVVDGRIVGHALYMTASDPEPELAVFVHQAYQGRGIGTKLCERVVALAAASGRDALVLDVERRNRVAAGLYRDLGFETVETHDRELHMRLPLSPSGDADARHRPTVDA